MGRLSCPQAGVTLQDALNIQAIAQASAYDCTNRGIHSRRITAAGQYTYGLNLVLCHIFFLRLFLKPMW